MGASYHSRLGTRFSGLVSSLPPPHPHPKPSYLTSHVTKFPREPARGPVLHGDPTHRGPNQYLLDGN